MPAAFASTVEPSDVVTRAQYTSLRQQVPIMYLLILINAVFLGLVTKSDGHFALSAGLPLALFVVIFLRAIIWLFRRSDDVSILEIRRYFRGTLFAAGIISAAFGAWGVLLLQESDPTRTAHIALFVFVGAISCCYCLQSLPAAARLVLAFGAAPVTFSLLISGDWHLAGISFNFILVAALILRTIATNRSSSLELFRSRSEIATMLSALEKSEEHYRYSIELNPQIPWLAAPDGSILELSPRWALLTGVKLEDALGWGWAEHVHPDDLPDVLKHWEKARAVGYGADVRYRLRCADGAYRWFRARATPRLDEAGNIFRWYGNLEDIHNQVIAEQALRESEERYRLATRATNDLIFELSHITNRITWANNLDSIFGHSAAEIGVSQQWWLDHIHPDDRPAISAAINQLKSLQQDNWAHEYRFRTPTGDYINIFSRGYVICDGDGVPVRSIGAMLDITTAKRVEEDLRWAANHDPLTGLPNRKLFGERLEQALKAAEAEGSCVGVTVLDVDDFKLINDNQGHGVGDRVLTTVAQRIGAVLPEGATLARLGGDEFAVILPGLSRKDARAETVARFLKSAKEPLDMEEATLRISLSAGAAMWPIDGATAEDVLKSADLALYTAKAEGGNLVKGFKLAMRERVETQNAMLRAAREALADDRIIPFYQPKIELRTGKVVGFEALLRWRDHRDDLQPPVTIRAAFEDPSLSTQLTDRMIERVLSDIQRLHDEGIDLGRIAINASPADFRKKGFADRILEKMHRARVRPDQIELEVTEHVLLGHEANIVEQSLRTLASEGVTIALDDFGTGYASLTHLHQFPVHVLKIDQSFVSRLDSLDVAGCAIVHGVIDISQRMNIVTVAEGIETEAQLDQLYDLGCEVGQGYLFSRPIDAKRLPTWTDQWSPTEMPGKNRAN